MENQRSLWRFLYLRNAIFQPSKIKLVEVCANAGDKHLGSLQKMTLFSKFSFFRQFIVRNGFLGSILIKFPTEIEKLIKKRANNSHRLVPSSERDF